MVFFNGPITACGMLVRMDFGPAVVLYNTPCAVCVRGLQACERTLWGLWILTTITMWFMCVRVLPMNDRDRDRDCSHKTRLDTINSRSIPSRAGLDQ